MKHLTAYLLFMAAFMPAGCVSNHSERVADVDPLGWMPGDTVWITYDNRDTILLRDISVLVRFNGNSQREPIEVAICTITPDSIIFCEQVMLNIAAAAVITNDHIESTLPYRLSSTLSGAGPYRFGFVPSQEYKGITSIGIKLE